MEIASPIPPSKVTLAIKVWFLPRFLGILPYARFPLGAGSPRPQARHGDMEPALVHEQHQPPGVQQAARQPSPQSPQTLVALGGYGRLFLSGQPPPSGSPEILRLIVALETFTPRASSKASQCSSSVRSGSFRSWVGSHLSSMAPFLAGGPGMGLASTTPLSLRRLSQRLIEGTEIPKTRATSFRGIPPSTASSALSLRSFEYAFMPGSLRQDQPSRNSLSDVRDASGRIGRSLRYSGCHRG